MHIDEWLIRLGGESREFMTHEHRPTRYRRTFTCFLISVGTGLLLHRLICILVQRKQMNAELRKGLEEMKRSIEEIRRIQKGFLVFCAWTKQIKVGERWMGPEEFLVTQLHLNLTHGISPEARLKLEQSLQPTDSSII